MFSSADYVVITCAVFGFFAQLIVTLLFLWLKSSMKGLADENVRQDKHLEATDTNVEKLRVGVQDLDVRVSVIEDSHNHA
jgi:hypothetical protein